MQFVYIFTWSNSSYTGKLTFPAQWLTDDMTNQPKWRCLVRMHCIIARKFFDRVVLQFNQEYFLLTIRYLTIHNTYIHFAKSLLFEMTQFCINHLMAYLAFFPFFELISSHRGHISAQPYHNAWTLLRFTPPPLHRPSVSCCFCHCFVTLRPLSVGDFLDSAFRLWCTSSCFSGKLAAVLMSQWSISGRRSTV